VVSPNKSQSFVSKRSKETIKNIWEFVGKRVSVERKSRVDAREEASRKYMPEHDAHTHTHTHTHTRTHTELDRVKIGKR
jgi:hypothetical protein